ncbi:hypothetical protein AAVH_17204 [Aphelenchoides avenae]|nr:hypothetical protein AAVH_21808 [Aphelenchus avenae]KAH7715432.1 hypothetical protein AAVH_17204 [Aphelenchus avenae]
MCMNIDREFLKSLKSIKDDFLVTDSLLALNWHYSDSENCTTEELLDALCAFPLRALNKSTIDFIQARRGYLHHEVVDGFLQMLASRGIFRLGDVTGQPDRFDNGIEAENVTEDEILDYCFGDYDDGGKGRLLHISRPQLSPKFVSKLIEACRASKSNHKLKLMITKNFIEGVEHEGVVPNGEEFSGPRGARWELTIDELSLRIAFYPPNQRHTRYMNGLILCERNVPGPDRYY